MTRRWKCPKCQKGVNAPERMRSDDIRRFCLPCSEETGRLVPRVCAVLARKRERSKKRGAGRAKRKRAEKRRREAPERRLRREERRAETAARRALRDRLKKRETLTRRVDATGAEMVERGYVEIRSPIPFYDLGVVVTKNTSNTRFVPRWADALVLGMPLSTGRPLIRWLQASRPSRDAVQAAALRSRKAAVKVAFDLYPFPDKLK